MRKLLRFVLLLLCPLSLFGHGFDVLVFSKTAGFRHNSISDGITMLQALGTAHNFGVTFTEDAATFVSELPNHQVVVFLNTTGDILDPGQQTAFQDWYRSGRGFVGIHAACDTEHGWPWYLEMLGGEFVSHSAVEVGTVEFLDQVHPLTNVTDPSTSSRILEWSVEEEWYNFAANPRGKVHVLATVDETTYSGGTHGDDHPIIWCQSFEGGAPLLSDLDISLQRTACKFFKTWSPMPLNGQLVS